MERLFNAAAELADPAQRAAFLDAACGVDESLRVGIEDLLRHDVAAGSFLESPAVDADATANDASVTDGEWPGKSIGPYKLLQRIGEGGMGTVYMAEQTQPVRRTVALKLIKAGMDSRQVLARFGAERQALALMDHPNIAKVLDAGATAEGRPYFVMELVKGIPITTFCDERRLTLRKRLELAIPVCQAVQHAHQKGIIHRDLKPSNVLIALYDGQPVPKIIDFGVAKATGPRLTDETLYTEFGAVVGTLEYMSPEQAELNQLDIDTRSDIYSLGVLIYELLTGSTPLQHKRLKSVLFLEVLRLIREEESPRPSVRLSSTEELPSIAACRHIEPRRLSVLVRGELDWIVMKALEKDRNRRYETANGLAADLRRYLDDEPVQACPPSSAYRLSKFARKYRGVMAMVCAFAAVLILASVVSAWQAVRANRAKAEAILAYDGENKQRLEAQNQRDRAIRAEDDAKANLARARAAVDDYLTAISESRLLNSPLPGLQPLRKELLTTALKYYEDFVSQNHDDTDLQADLAAATLRVGEIIDQIGSKQDALKAFQTASEMYKSLAQAAAEPLRKSYRAGEGRCLVRMAMIQANHGQSDESLTSFERSIALLNQLQRDPPRDSAIRADLALAHHYMASNLHGHGKPDEAIHHQRAAIALLESLSAEFPNQLSYRIELGMSLSDLGQILVAQGQPAEAFDSVHQANQIQRTLVAEHPEDPQLRYTLALSTRGMAVLFKILGRWKESRQHFVESVEIMERIVVENPAVNEFRRVLATSSAELGEYLIDRDEIEAGLNALAKAREQAEMVRKTNPNDVRNLNALAMILRGIGKTRAKQGKTGEALESLGQAIAIGNRIVGENHMFAYDLACGLALAGEVTANLPADPSKPMQKSSQVYSDKAMAALQQAVDRGYREADWIERDPDLRSLRPRSDFQALLKTLRQKPQTPPDGR